MASLKTTIVLALLAFTSIQQVVVTPAVTNVCLRNKFIGGPQNTIIKAQELLDSLLQYSNVSTTVLYFGTRTAVNAVNGETSVFYVFKINDAANTANPSRLLILSVTTAQCGRQHHPAEHPAGRDQLQLQLRKCHHPDQRRFLRQRRERSALQLDQGVLHLLLPGLRRKIQERS